MTVQELETSLALKTWLQSNGGEFHPDAIFIEGSQLSETFVQGPDLPVLYLDAYGHRIIAARDIPADTHIVSCPFDLMITSELSRKAVCSVLGDSSKLAKESSQWTEREWLATYLSLHWIVEDHERWVKADKNLHVISMLSSV